jgi:hypothetical protein
VASSASVRQGVCEFGGCGGSAEWEWVGGAIRLFLAHLPADQGVQRRLL